MSNPGVIKLVKKEYRSHVFWMDDNIGESIHMHLDQLRLDLTVNEFMKLADDVENVLEYFFKEKGIDIKTLDTRFLNYQLDQILNIGEILKGSAKLSEMLVFDNSGVCRLPDSAGVKFLESDMRHMPYRERESNYWGQTNAMRMKEVFSLIQSKGYPFNDEFIVLEKTRHFILDGWHRAACLYHLYGNLEVPVQFVSMIRDDTVCKICLPVNELKKGGRLILYGAGQNGKNYKDQIVKFGYRLVAWCDEKFNELIEIDGIRIEDPFVIKEKKYDHVVVSIMDVSIQQEIKSMLITHCGVEPQKIIFA